MLKNIFLPLTSLIALALSTETVFSATLSKLREAEPFPQWQGFYAGLNAGGIWTQDTNINILSSFVQGSQAPESPQGGIYTGTQSALGASGNVSTTNAGFLGGGQLGFNWQLKNQLFGGLETDIQGIASGDNNGQTSTIVPLIGTFDGGNTTYVAGEFFTTSLNSSKRTNYLGTLRGRLGKLVMPALIIHGSGGLAYGSVSASTTITQTNNDSTLFPPTASLTPQTITSGSYSNTLCGWTVGADAEWLFLPNWSAKLEYLYYDLGQISYTVSPTVITIPALAHSFATVNSQVSTRFNGNIIHAGINYHFA